jgi:hypothetical protein
VEVLSEAGEEIEIQETDEELMRTAEDLGIDLRSASAALLSTRSEEEVEGERPEEL